MTASREVLDAFVSERPVIKSAVSDPRMRRGDLPDHAIAKQLHRSAVFARGVNLISHLRDHARLLRLQAHLPRLPNGVRERFLAVNVFAEPQRRHRDQRVRVIRRGDLHGVEARAEFREHLAKILERRDSGEFRGRLVEPTRIDVAESNELLLKDDILPMLKTRYGSNCIVQHDNV